MSLVVHALLGVVDGRTQEASREVAGLDEALDAIRELVAEVPTFRAITLLHVEDWPAILADAERDGP